MINQQTMVQKDKRDIDRGQELWSRTKVIPGEICCSQKTQCFYQGSGHHTILNQKDAEYGIQMEGVYRHEHYGHRHKFTRIWKC